MLCDCKPALQQIENAHRKGMPEGLRDWERGGLLEAIAYYRSKLEAVVFMWVPAHVGIACNAYADAVATAHLGDNDSEDASKVVRDAVRTRPCMYTVRREAAENAEKREIVDRRTYGHMCKSAHEWVCEQYRKTVRPGSHTAGVAGRLWSEVAVASLKHRWDNKMRLPDENGGKDRRATFDDVGDHNVTTKTILGARVRQQVGVPHGAHHRRILEGEKKRGMRGPATRSAFWGCRACKAARDEATKEAREARRRRGELTDWDDWKQEDSEPPQASLAHILSGSCAGNKEEARHFMRKLDKHTARATARVEREAPDSKDTATFLRRARAASLKAKGSRFGALAEEEYDKIAPVIACTLPALTDSIPERKRRELAGEVTSELQVVGKAASIAIQTWVRNNDKTKARAEEREKNIGWIKRLFTAWRVSHTERTERRAERKEDGEDDSEEDEPVEIQLSDVTMHPKGTPAPASSVEARVFEERVDLSNNMTCRQMIGVGVRNVVLARGELDRLEGPGYAARRTELRRKAKEAARTRDRQAAAPQDEAEENDATEEEVTRERTTRVGRPRGGTKVAARIGERLRREIGRGRLPRVGDG